MNGSNQDRGRWNEARTARMIAMVVSGAVVAADLWLLIVFVRVVGGLPGGWRAYWYIPIGILGILVFASLRFRRHYRAFKAEEETETEEGEE